MAELGRKITCTECGVKFYDLGRTDVVCPKCGHVPPAADEGPLLKRPARRSPSREVETVDADEAGELGSEVEEGEEVEVETEVEVEDDLDLDADEDDEDDD